MRHSNHRIFDRKLIAEKDYWMAKLAANVGDSKFDLDYPRPEICSGQTDTIEIVLPSQVCTALNKLTKGQPLLLYAVLMAAVKLCLYKYTGNSHVVVGSPVYGQRDQTALSANVLALIDHVDPHLSFRQFLLKVHQTLTEAYARQRYPFQRLIQDLELDYIKNRCPLFDVALILKNIHPDLSTINNDISLTFIEEAGQIRGNATFNKQLFKQATIKRFTEHLSNILSQGVGDTDRLIHELGLASEIEQQYILTDWNGQPTDYPQQLCIHEYFEKQVQRMPDATAVVFERQRLTYQTLNMRANQVAHFLQKLGVGPEVPVGIHMERSLEMVISLLAVLKAGGAYVPLNPTHPKERQAFLLEDTQVPVLLTQAHLRDRLPLCDAQIVCVDTDWSEISHQPTENPKSLITLDNLIAILYTSGSTGNPKGALIDHRGFLNLCLWYQSCCSVDAKTKSLSMLAFSFDAAFKNIMAPLLCGGQTILANAGYYDPPNLLATIFNEGVTLINSTPSLIYPIVDIAAAQGYRPLSSLTYMTLGGEALSLSKLQHWLNSPHCQCNLTHLYGPTECSDLLTGYSLQCTEANVSAKVPIGKPLHNTKLYVLNGDNNLQPTGQVGELCATGHGLARGYLNRPDLTAEKFTPNPYSSGGRIYRTGDLGCWLLDGNLEFAERIDHQVKIRGIRMELGEIEAVLTRYPAVQEVIVLAQTDKLQEKRLVAYVVAQKGQTITTGDLRHFTQNRLPEYMVPSAFVVLDAMPLTPNGKIDRLALPIPENVNQSAESTFVAPRTPLEEILSGICAEVLNLERVGIYSNFFEIGGHSLLATQAVSHIRETLQVDIPLRMLFEAPSVAQLSKKILENANERDRIETVSQMLIDLAQLSDDEVEAQLMENQVVV